MIITTELTVQFQVGEHVRNVFGQFPFSVCDVMKAIGAIVGWHLSPARVPLSGSAPRYANPTVRAVTRETTNFRDHCPPP